MHLADSSDREYSTRPLNEPGGIAHDVFARWRDSRQQVYVSVFNASGVPECEVFGRMRKVTDSTAIVAETHAQVRLPIGSATTNTKVDAAEGHVVSVTLAWPDGRSAFLTLLDS